MSLIPTAFGPTTDRSEGAARGLVLHNHEPVGRLFIRHQTKSWMCFAVSRLTAQTVGRLYTSTWALVKAPDLH